MNLEAKPDPRSDLYYGRWRWVASFYLENIWRARSMDLDKFREDIEYRQRWNRNTIDHQSCLVLEDWITFMQPWQGQYRQIISYNHAYIYTNSWDLITDIVSRPYIPQGVLREARVILPKDTVVLQEPQNLLRTYMQDRRIDPGKISALREYLYSQPWKIGPGFKKMLDSNRDFYWSRRYHYVDHDQDQDLFFLNMIVPGMIRKTLPIVAQRLNT